MNVGYSRRISMPWVICHVLHLWAETKSIKGKENITETAMFINLCDPEFTEVEDPAKVSCGQTKNTATRDVTAAMNVNHINSFIMFNVLSDFIRWRTNPPSKDPTVPEPAKTIPTNK